jgi:DNA-binding NarL/FixJ family response regulator
LGLHLQKPNFATDPYFDLDTHCRQINLSEKTFMERITLAKPIVLIIDEMKLRRAGTVSFLQAWAESLGVSLAAVEPTALPENVEHTDLRMVVLSVGGQTISDVKSSPWVEDLRRLVPKVPLVLLSDQEHPEEVTLAFREGVRGFIPTSMEPAVALQAFTFIMGGGSFFPPTVLLHRPLQRPTTGLASDLYQSLPSKSGVSGAGALTPRQQEVFDLLRLGKSNKLIARSLSMCEPTVKVHVRQIMRKFGVSNRTEAALLAVDAGNRRLVNGLIAGADRPRLNTFAENLKVQ